VASTKFLPVVEDDLAMQNLLRVPFHTAGDRIATAADGPQALAYWRDGEVPDAFVLDLNLPVLSGGAFR